MDVVGILRRRWIVIALCALLVPIAPLVLVLDSDTTYRSAALVAVAPPEPREPDYAYVPPFETSRTVRDVLLSRGVAVDASEALGGSPTAGQLQEGLVVEADPDGWQSVDVFAEGSSPEAARETTQAVVDVGLPLAEDAVREGSRVVLAVPASEGNEVSTSPWLRVLAIIGFSILIGFVAAALVDLLARQRSRNR